MPKSTHGDFEELLANLPATANVLALRTAKLAQDGEELQAESILRLAISKHATSSLRETLGRVLIRQNRHKEAMTEMVLVLREEPESPGALMVLAICLVECGELDRGGKMLQKAALAGAAHSEVSELEEHWRYLVAQSGGTPDFTMPEFPPATLGETRPESEAEEAHRQRNETLMGRPNTDRLDAPPIFDDPTGMMPAHGSFAPHPSSIEEPRRVPPPPLQSGSFASLSTYDIEGSDENDLDTMAIAADKLRLSDHGPLERVPTPGPADRSNEYADPDDMTMALSIDEADIASPLDATAHIPYDEVEQGSLSPGAQISNQPVYPAPDIAEDPFGNYFQPQPNNQFAHAPPSDLDDLPAWDATMGQPAATPTGPAPGWGNELPVFSEPGPQQPAHQPGESQLTERPVAQSMLDYGDWNDIPAAPQYAPQAAAPQFQSQPNFAHDPYGSAPSSPPAAAPYDPNPQKPYVEPSNEQWGGPRDELAKRENTAVAGEPKTTSSMLEKRWPIVVVVFLAVVLFSFVGVIIVAGASLSSDLESTVEASNLARATDTFQGYVDSEARLKEAVQLASFMGPGFDRFVETTIPLPGLSGSELRRRATADLAAVAALLEYRYEKSGSRTATERIEAAKEAAPADPAVVVAQAYVALTENRPSDAVELLEAAQAKDSSDLRIAEMLTWALLAIDRVPAATAAAQALRDEPAQTVQQKFLLASVDAARNDANASKAFADVFAASPDHIDSRIARSYTLRGDDSALEDAKKVLETALKLSDGTTAYQKARATAAFGSIYRATGEKEAAEERFRSAVAKAPTRGDVYLPLLEFLASEGKLEEVQATLEGAKSNRAYSLPIAFFDAEQQLLASKPEVTLSILDALEFNDAHKAFLKGLALIVQSNTKAAVEVLEAGQNAPGDATDTQALFHVAKAMSYTSEAAQDAVYQLDGIKSKHGDNAVVHWASALASSIHAEITTSKKTRGERLKAASADIERATELADWAPIHFTRCDIHAKALDLEAAERFCASGAKLAPTYSPGIVITARLRLQEGKFEEAKKLSDRALKLRPNDPVVGLLAARVAIERLELDDAAKLINRWLGKEVDKYEMSLLEGRREFAREDYTRAAGYLKEAFELRPADGEAAVYYAQTLARLGETKNADVLIRGKTKGGISYLSHPTWSGYAWAVLGEVRRKQRRVSDALSNLKKAESIFKKQVVPKRYYSHLYTEFALTYKAKYRKWRHPLVKKMLDRGRKRGDSMDPGLNMTYGRLYLEKRRPNYDAAMRYIQKVVDVAPYKCDAVEALRTLFSKAEKDQKDVDALEEIYRANCAPDEATK